MTPPMVPRSEILTFTLQPIATEGDSFLTIEAEALEIEVEANTVVILGILITTMLDMRDHQKGGIIAEMSIIVTMVILREHPFILPIGFHPFEVKVHVRLTIILILI